MFPAVSFSLFGVIIGILCAIYYQKHGREDFNALPGAGGKNGGKSKDGTGDGSKNGDKSKASRYEDALDKAVPGNEGEEELSYNKLGLVDHVPVPYEHYSNYPYRN